MTKHATIQLELKTPETADGAVADIITRCRPFQPLTRFRRGQSFCPPDTNQEDSIENPETRKEPPCVQN